MSVGQISGIGKQDGNKIYRVTIFKGTPAANSGVHFYSTQKIETLSDLKTYVSDFGYTYTGTTWKFIDVVGYYSSTSAAASKIFVTQNNDCLLISVDNSQSSFINATFVCDNI